MEEKLIKKADELIRELTELGDMVLRLKEEKEAMEGELKKKEEAIKRLKREREIIKKRISALIDKIEELEDRITKGDYV